jgi:colanic acid biosynthesis glycosyl transferase WcaI
MARLCKATSWLHIQDLEVDAAFEMGLLQNPRLNSVARFLEKIILQQFDRVSKISSAMLQRLHDKGLNPQNTLLLPNWVDTARIRPENTRNRFRQELNIARDAVVCLFSGNLGLKQGLELVTATAGLLHNQPLHFVICGNGPLKTTLVEQCRHLNNITFIDLQPQNRFNELLNLADIHLLPQLANAADLVLPSKLTGMLASGRPVVAAAAPLTEIARAISDCGLISPPGDHEAFAASLLQLAQNPRQRRQFGDNARLYAEKNLDRDIVLGNFNAELIRLRTSCKK